MRKGKSREGPGRKNKTHQVQLQLPIYAWVWSQPLEMVKLLRATHVKRTDPTPAAISSHSSQLEMGACNTIHVPC